MTGRARWRGKGPGTVDRKSLPSRLRHTFVSRLFVGRLPVRFPAGHGYFGADVRPASASDRLAGRRMSRTAASCRSEIRAVRMRDVRKGTTGARKSRSKKRASDRLDRFRWVALRKASSCVVPYGPGSVRGSAVFRDEAGRAVAGRFSGVFALLVHGTCRTVERGMPWCGKCGSTDGPEILRRANGRATIESRYRGAVSLGFRSGFGRIVGQRGKRFGRKSGRCGSRNRFRGMPFPLPEFAMGYESGYGGFYRERRWGESGAAFVGCRFRAGTRRERPEYARRAMPPCPSRSFERGARRSGFRRS